MLATLESALSSAPDIATRLRAHVSRIDNYMTEAALQQHNNIHIPMAQPQKSSSHPYLPSLLNVGCLLCGHCHASSLQFHPPASDVRDEFGDLSRQNAPTSLNGSVETALAGLASTQVGDPAEWAPSEDIPPTQQFQLPDDLFQDWPFDFGQGDVFDWLGDVQAQAQAQAHTEAAAPQSETWI